MKRRIICLITAICMMLCFTGCLDGFLNDSSSSSSSSSESKTTKKLSALEAAAPRSSKKCKNKNYKDIVEEFKEAGFTNIETKSLEDMVIGLLVSEDEVKTVSIDDKDDFDEGDVFNKDVKVIISYHSYPAKDSESESTPESNGNPKWQVTNESLIWFKNSLSSNYDYYYVYEIKNTGDTNLLLNTFKSSIRVNGEENGSAFACPQIIEPGETGYYFNLQNDLGRSFDPNSGVSVSINATVEEIDESVDKYQVNNIKMNTQGPDNDIGVTGELKNDSDEDTGFFNICCLYLDSAGKVIAITNESVSNVKAHDTYSINSGTVFFDSGKLSSKVKSVKVIASKPYHW